MRFTTWKVCLIPILDFSPVVLAFLKYNVASLNHIFFYFTDWKKRTKNELLQLEELKNTENYSLISASVYDDIKKTAQVIYDEYLSEKVREIVAECSIF